MRARFTHDGVSERQFLTWKNMKSRYKISISWHFRNCIIMTFCWCQGLHVKRKVWVIKCENIKFQLYFFCNTWKLQYYKYQRVNPKKINTEIVIDILAKPQSFNFATWLNRMLKSAMILSTCPINVVSFCSRGDIDCYK